MSRPRRVLQRPLQQAQLVMLLLSWLLLNGTTSCLAFSTLARSSTSQRHRNGPIGFSLGGSKQRLAAAVGSAVATATAATSSSSTTSTSTVVDLPFTEYYTPDAPSSHSNPAPVLLLHGLLGSKRNFASLAKSLGNQLDIKRRILAVDLRNHGEHSCENWQEDMTYASMARDVAHFITLHNLGKVILVGHSMGGKVAQTLALTRPELVQGLVVLDMAPVAYQPSEPHWQAVTSIIHTLQSIVPSSNEQEPLTKQKVDKLLQATITDPAIRGFCLTNWDVKQHEWMIPMDKIANSLNVLAAFDIHDNHHQQHVNGDTSPSPSTPSTSTEGLQYHGDVFFIHGGQSKFVRHAHMETIASYFPNHMLTTIRGAGHWVHAEAPDDTLALLKRYLDR